MPPPDDDDLPCADDLERAESGAAFPVKKTCPRGMGVDPRPNGCRPPPLPPLDDRWGCCCRVPAESSPAAPAVDDDADVALPGTIRLAGFRGLNLPACVGGTMLYYYESVGMLYCVVIGWQGN